MSQLQIQRRNELISFIQQTNDLLLLEELWRLIRNHSNEHVLTVNDDQRKAILLAQQEILDGKGISAEEADAEIEEWLKR